MYPTEVVETETGSGRRLEKVYLLTTADNPANIPTAGFEREGYRYTLLDVTRQDYTESETREHTETVTLDSGTKDMDKVMPRLAATREITTEDGFTGILTLDTASITVEAAGYGSSSRTVTQSYPNLSDADSSLIPKTITDGRRTLTLADVQWLEAGEFYNATASYTGTATSKYATGYVITAEYAGEVVKTISGEMIYTAVFSGTPINAPAETEPGPDDGNNDSMETPPPEQAEPGTSGGIGLKWLLVLPIGAGTAGLAFLGKFLLKKYKAKKNGGSTLHGNPVHRPDGEDHAGDGQRGAGQGRGPLHKHQHLEWQRGAGRAQQRGDKPLWQDTHPRRRE